MAGVLKLIAGGRAPAGRSLGRRLRETFAADDPVGRAFLRYLSSRADLIPATECLALADLPDRGPAIPWPKVRACLDRELGPALETELGNVDPEPFDTGLLLQSHRASLTDGTPVTVKLVRPGLREGLEGDLERLTALVGRRTEAVRDRGALVAGLADFRLALARKLDLVQEAEDLEWLAACGSGRDRAPVPVPVRSCSTVGVLTRKSQAGTTLESLAAAGPPPGGARRSLRFCRAWFSMAFELGLFPCEPSARKATFLDDGKLSFDGPFRRLPPESRDDLLEYLSAVSGGDLDRAADALIRALPAGSDWAETALRRRIRHAEPFRDLSWDVPDERFVKLALMHWREVRALGLRQRPAHDDFFRGLFVVARESRSLDPDLGAVLEGFRDLRLSLIVDEFRQLAEPDGWAELAGGQLSTLMGLPQKLDRTLSLVAETGASPERRDDRRSEDEGRSGAWAVVSALLLAMVGVVALVRHLGVDDPTAGWIERVGSGLVLLLGGLALRASGGRG